MEVRGKVIDLDSLSTEELLELHRESLPASLEDLRDSKQRIDTVEFIVKRPRP